MFVSFLHHIAYFVCVCVCMCGLIGCARFVSLTKRNENEEAKKGSGARLSALLKKFLLKALSSYHDMLYQCVLSL